LIEAKSITKTSNIQKLKIKMIAC